MDDQERIAQLEAENAALKQQVTDAQNALKVLKEKGKEHRSRLASYQVRDVLQGLNCSLSAHVPPVQAQPLITANEDEE